MRIGFIPADREGVGSYRLLYPMAELESRGLIEAIEFPVIDSYTNERGFQVTVHNAHEPPEADLYVLQRPHQDVHLQLIHKLQETAPVVVEIDDNYLALPPSNPAWTSTHPNWRVRAREYAEREGKTRLSEAEVVRFAGAAKVASRHWVHACCAAADAITVSTPALREAYSRFNDRVHLLPNFLRWADWENVTPIDPSIRFRVGYMGDARWHGDDLRLLAGTIGPWLGKHPEALFVAAGEDDIHELLDIPKKQRVTMGYRKFPGHTAITREMHVGLVPLEDNQFNRCKSWLKGLEYNAAGVPFIASQLPEYEALIARGAVGQLAWKPRHWVKWLDEALNQFKEGERWQWKQGSGLPTFRAQQFARTMTIEQPDHHEQWLHTWQQIREEWI